MPIGKFAGMGMGSAMDMDDEDDVLPVCPKCSSPMRIRTRKVDGKKFLGCVMYANNQNACNGTREITSIPTDVLKKLLAKDSLGVSIQPKAASPAVNPGAGASALANAFKKKLPEPDPIDKWAKPADMSTAGKKHAGKGRRRHYRVNVDSENLDWMNAVLAYED